MNWSAYIVVFFTSSIKFLFSAFVGINLYKLSKIETFIVISLGGIVTAIVFYSIGSRLIKSSQKKRKKKLDKLKMEGKPLPLIMTKTNKLIVKTKQKFGVWGIAFLTASVLSIPLGSIICAKFYRHKKSTIFIIFLLIVINSFILSSIASYFPSIGK